MKLELLQAAQIRGTGKYTIPSPKQNRYLEQNFLARCEITKWIEEMCQVVCWDG